MGTKDFYLIFFWTEIALNYSQDSADYFIISGSLYINAYCQTRAKIYRAVAEKIRELSTKTELKVHRIKVNKKFNVCSLL